MYLHIDLLNNVLSGNFPKEIGEIKKGFTEKDKIQKVYYKSFENEIFDIENFKAKINSISKINFFIGTNNSGKSRFLRGLYKINEIYFSEDNKTPIELLYEIQNFIKIDEELPFDDDTVKILKRSYSGVSDLFSNSYDIPNFEKKVLSFREYLEKNRNNEFKKLLEITYEYIEKIKFHNKNKFQDKFYIPILRCSNTNINSDTFNNAIKLSYDIEKNVFTGLRLYNEFSDKNNSPYSERKKIKEFENFLSNTFFNNKKIEITANKNPQTILFRIDEQEHPIQDIGDGIQMLVILLFPIFTSNDNTCFFIEEPETHLHPGLQRIFIETLLNDDYLKSKNLRYFFTTHSNHFLDLSLQSNDISIFQFQKESQEKFNIKNVKPSKETLDLLGVNNSSVLMANASIWVEGPTDRKYISKFLKLYCEEKKHQNLKEDIDFAFFEYGGNLIHHYLFDESFDEVFTEEEVREKINAFALSNKIYLLADNDNADGKKLERRQKLEDISANQKYFQYQNTNYREIENLLPVKVIKDFLVELVNSSEVDKLSRLNFERKDYISVGLAEFIEDLFENNNIKDFKKFRDDSGTLKSSYKTKLCEFIINGNYNYQDLIFDNELLDEIVEKLYSFVKS